MISKGVSNITFQQVRELVSDFTIANRYLGITVVPEIINSPFRQDKNPSFSIYENPKNRRLYYKDFGNGDGGSIYDLLSRIWNCSISEVCKRIVSDSPELIDINKRITVKCHKKESGQLEVVVREWKQWDLDYWESFGISKEWLEFGDIYPISNFIIIKDLTQQTITCEKYAYVYVERKDNKVTYKIYQPYSKDFKWVSKHDSSVWDLWRQLPKTGDNLIITSSRKDALCIWSNSGIPSVSLQGEGYIPKEKVINELKSRFKNIYILYDNDFQSEVNHGRQYGKIISEKFNLKQVELPVYLNCKDTSDTCLKYGRRKVYEVIHELLNI